MTGLLYFSSWEQTVGWIYCFIMIIIVYFYTFICKADEDFFLLLFLCQMSYY